MRNKKSGRFVEIPGSKYHRVQGNCQFCGRKKSHGHTKFCMNCRPERNKLRVESRFWSNVPKGDRSSCWEWKGVRVGSMTIKYGQFNFPGGRTAAHRFSWYLAHGPIPNGLQVLHKCDNPPCVNPSHLFLGTQADNVHDCVAKGRARGAQKSVQEKR